MHTRTQELWFRPGYNIQACCTQAGPAHAAGHGDGMERWQHSSHLHCVVVRRGWSPVTLTHAGTVSQATKTNGIDRLPCGYVYRSSRWIGKSVSGLRLCLGHHTSPTRARWSLNLTYDVTTQNKSRKWFTVSGWSKQASKQAIASKQSNEVTRVQWSHASVGLAQTRPNYSFLHKLMLL